MTTAKYNPHSKASLLLEDGTLLHGISVGYSGTAGGEICFNTGMTGYQEIYTDPSYYGQVIISTTSHIGNYNVIDDEQESANPQISGIIVNEFSWKGSRKTSDETLHKYLNDNKVVGIADLDTRKLVKHVRTKGAMNCIISSEYHTKEELQKELDKIPSMLNLELSTQVTAKEPYYVGDPSGIKVAVLDLGCKTSILRNMTSRGIYCKVFPAKTSFEEMKEWGPKGYFISNGPGDPAATSYAVETVKEIQESGSPMFGICLGHQMIALANDVETYKMHHGHRGLNHPVKNLLTGKSEITSQNHGFSVSMESVEQHPNVEMTHINLNDKTVEGIRIKDKKVFSVQYHPEAGPGPHDSRYLFDDFIALMN
ncbi:glutamine-hydrolyzing carbamoyl-phosphate synthase small subunit [Mangrovivirga cuniculi]|uniref:Carbamoyl phosphate synthase small chain n=1 Tax=Mangrovivirga cuniculi TaxID=2715131 RepID=A0A4D7JR09_9BACT|nr:glutamine-hydrolyzing carbamoyl-phosphate synthase small subunit [Mangrovivirga cuniculi]QCK14056.1 carbamoyl phosphate synthase small subunit [Mangrovivirga cuniculi]